MLLREEWHLSHFSSRSCPGQSWGLIQKLLLQAKLLFFSGYFFALPQPRGITFVAPKANWAEGDSGDTGGLDRAVRVGTGPGKQAPSKTHDAAGTLGFLCDPLLCDVFSLLLLHSHRFGWLNTRATLKEPTGGCGLAKADRLLASYCWFSTLVHCCHLL